MRVVVTLRSADVDAGLKSYAREKLGKLDHLVSKPMQAHAVFAKERFQFVVEVVLTVNGEPVKVLCKHEDAQAALDGAVAKLDSRLRRMKDKQTSHRPAEVRRGARARRAADAPDALPLEPPGPAFVRSDSFAETPLTPELAVLELQTRGLELLLFKNTRTKRANVIYRRPDGSFGLIEGPTRTRG